MEMDFRIYSIIKGDVLTKISQSYLDLSTSNVFNFLTMEMDFRIYSIIKGDVLTKISQCLEEVNLILIQHQQLRISKVDTLFLWGLGDWLKVIRGGGGLHVLRTSSPVPN